MQVTRIQSSPTQTEADAIVVGVYSDGPLPKPAAEVDRAAGGVLSSLVDRQEISGKLCETLSLWSPAGVKAPQVVVVGMGDRQRQDRQAAFQSAAAAARHLAKKKRQKVAYFLDDGWPADRTESGVCGALVGCQGQDLYRAEKTVQPFGELLWAGNENGIANGIILGESVNLARRLVNEPPQAIYPDSFARQAAEVAGGCGLEIEIWDQERLEAERAGSLLAVAKGSSRPPRLVIVRHHAGKAGGAGQRRGRAGSPLLALVGKGVTFDSGGLSLKTNDGMKTMKCDMAGAATVLGAMQAIARLRLPVNAIGLMGLVENMPGPGAMKLGDVLVARSGKTIEVQNTDAEGRLVLADVLDVAVEQGAKRIIDLATLTGSCVVALGNDVAGLMTNDQDWCDTVAAATRTCGEPAWQLPMFDDYREQIKSDVADIRNVGEGRWGGAITAAKFLEEFVAGVPWTHMDIAGPAYLEKPKAWIDGGGSGAFVRTLVEVARELGEAAPSQGS